MIIVVQWCAMARGIFACLKGFLRLAQHHMHTGAFVSFKRQRNASCLFGYESDWCNGPKVLLLCRQEWGFRVPHCIGCSVDSWLAMRFLVRRLPRYECSERRTWDEVRTKPRRRRRRPQRPCLGAWRVRVGLVSQELSLASWEEETAETPDRSHVCIHRCSSGHDSRSQTLRSLDLRGFCLSQRPPSMRATGFVSWAFP